MFRELWNRIIIVTMAVTTAVLVLAGVLIMLFSSATRPEPKPMVEIEVGVSETSGSSGIPGVSGVFGVSEQEVGEFIRSDRKEGDDRLLMTLLSVGAIVEIAVFVIIYSWSEKIVEPVKDAYGKQKTFIANASHELKTPLAVIEANMEALEVDEEGEKWKENIEAEITRANKLVLDLLQLAKMDAGSAGKSAKEEVELGAVVRERVEVFRAKFGGKMRFRIAGASGSSGSGKTSRSGASGSGKIVWVLAKQDFLQVLDILLDNATKYGEKKIEVVLDKEGISVANDGAVVAKEDLEKIFDRFYQTDKTKEGSGLGLAIAKAICEQNGWEISCESEKGKTKFGVRF